MINLNLVGAFNMTRLAAADMMATKPMSDGERGMVLFTTSVAAFEGQIGQAAYTAAKGGLAALVIQLAGEFATAGIRVMGIAPGIFLTPLLYKASPEVQQSLAESIPFPKRFGHADEFAELVVHTVQNRYLNGEVIRLATALCAWRPGNSCARLPFANSKSPKLRGSALRQWQVQQRWHSQQDRDLTSTADSK